MKKDFLGGETLFPGVALVAVLILGVTCRHPFVS